MAITQITIFFSVSLVSKIYFLKIFDYDFLFYINCTTVLYVHYTTLSNYSFNNLLQKQERAMNEKQYIGLKLTVLL